MSKRAFTKHRALVLGIIILLLIEFWYVNNYCLTTTTVEIVSDKIQDEIRIVQITDLHGASFGIDNIEIINSIREQQPDFIAVTGDLYTYNSDNTYDEKGCETALRLMTALALEYDVYYVNGEHDNDADFFLDLEKVGVILLRGKRIDININTTKLSLFGIGNVYFSEDYSLDGKFTTDDTRYNILLAHLVNFKAYSDFGFDLSLCGDTHGGIARLPYIGAIYYDNRLLPKITDSNSPCYDKGLFKEGSSSLFISSGLGSYPAPLRLFNLPEIAVITLIPQN